MLGGSHEMFGVIDHMSTVDAAMRLPLGLREMVLAVWLTVRGFNPSAIAPGRPAQS